MRPEQNFRRNARVKRRREEVSQRALSEAVGFTHQTALSKIEAGDRSIRLDEAVAIATHLGTTVEALIQDEAPR